MNDLVLRFVTMPMAIKIFKQDRESFTVSKVHVVYFGLIDSVLKQLQADFNNLRADMYSKHHLDIKRIDKLRYKVNKEIVEFSPGELRNKTEELMKEYLATAQIEEQERTWE